MFVSIQSYLAITNVYNQPKIILYSKLYITVNCALQKTRPYKSQER